MKKKANGTFRARVNMRGYEQIEGQHYDSASISSPVNNDVSVRTLLTIMIMANYYAYIVDIKGAFLHGEIFYCKIPEGFREDYDPKEYCWLLERTAYGLKQAARSFWNKLLEAMKQLGFQRSLCDPCVYYKWTNRGLVLWISWIDDMLCIGHPDDVKENKEAFMHLFECDDIGEFKEYVGCKIERTNHTIKFTQPVLQQSYKATKMNLTYLTGNMKHQLNQANCYLKSKKELKSMKKCKPNSDLVLANYYI